MSADTPPVKPPIFNLCLAYLKFLMLTKDKLHIINFMVARFKWQDLKRAHELLSKFCNPDSEYNKRGPNSGDRSRAEFFCSESYRILANLDKENLSPVIAVPYEDIGAIQVLNDDYGQKRLDQRLKKIEDKMLRLDALEVGLSKLNRLAESGTDKPAAIHPSVQLRVRDQSRGGSKSRSSSVESVKRFRADSNSSDEPDFDIPKYNQSKNDAKKFKLQSDNNHYSDVVKSNLDPHPTNGRRAANWGSASHSANSRFTGVVPELFVFNCSDKPEESEVKSYLEGKALNIIAVKRMSPQGSVRYSFKVTVGSYADYEKIISGGQYLPSGVGVKRFIPPRGSFKPSAPASVVKNTSVHQSLGQAPVGLTSDVIMSTSQSADAATAINIPT